MYAAMERLETTSVQLGEEMLDWAWRQYPSFEDTAKVIRHRHINY